MVGTNAQWIHERSSIVGPGQEFALNGWLTRTQGHGIVEHYRYKCSTIQYGPLVEQKKSMAKS
jgi:hypothetical protein